MDEITEKLVDKTLIHFLERKEILYYKFGFRRDFSIANAITYLIENIQIALKSLKKGDTDIHTCKKSNTKVIVKVKKSNTYIQHVGLV